MQINSLFKISTLACAITLASCGGGDINLSSNVDNSVGDTTITNPAATVPVVTELPGKSNSVLGQSVSSALGFDVAVQVLDGQITTDMTLVASADSKPIFYAISGALEVMADATLTVEPGVVLFGQSGGDYVVVHRDAKIMAEGTKANPIILTSLEDVKGSYFSRSMGRSCHSW